MINKQSTVSLPQLLRGISIHHFRDAGGTIAALAYDLGLTYERFSWRRFNASLEFFLFREKWDVTNYVHRAKSKDLKKIIAACEKLIPQFRAVALHHLTAGQIKNEFLFTCDEIIHTCRRTALRQQWFTANPDGNVSKPLPKSFQKEMRALRDEIIQLKKRFIALWLARNKRSRLDDVAAEFDRLAEEYKQWGRGAKALK